MGRVKPAAVLLTMLMAALWTSTGVAQELEPRLFSNSPMGTNFLSLGYGYSRGNILLDPAIPIEDLDARLHIATAGYVRTFGILGQTAKAGVVLPYSWGDWKGALSGENRTRSAAGMGDPVVRLSWLFQGAPALDASEFASYRQTTTVGAGLTIRPPLGKYEPDKLINLGSNRWLFRPVLGLSNRRGSWILEAAGAVWLFTDNTNFFGGSTLQQRPLFAVKGHVARIFPRGAWAALNVGYGVGGRSLIDGVERETFQENVRVGFVIALPVGRAHALRLAVVSGFRGRAGGDFDSVGLGYQYRWGRRQSREGGTSG